MPRFSACWQSGKPETSAARYPRDYVKKRMAAGDTKTEAIRALRRRISDEVFRRMRQDEALHATATASLAQAA